MDDKTHFGYETVPTTTKQHKVQALFSRVAAPYDHMNDLMSFGLHRCWKRFTLDQTPVLPHAVVLDCAGGTGDLALAWANRLGPHGQVVLLDFQDLMCIKSCDVMKGVR